MLNFILNFLTERVFQVRIKNKTSDILSQNSGVPQGSVLSPTLFVLATNSIKNIMPPNINFRLYADDLLIYHSASDPEISIHNLQNCVNLLQG